MGIRRNLLKKSYISPEFEYIRIDLSTVVCASYEGVVDDGGFPGRAGEGDYDDDV